jgi:tetratricopeptide (TPR) repeat protein
MEGALLDRRVFTATLFLVLLATLGPAQALDARSERDRLAAHLQTHPEDEAATYRFVLVATEFTDYEAAIGALERLLMFNPELSRARKELGFLYARLGNWQIAAQHLRQARASGALDAVQVAQIDAQLPDIEKRNEPSRVAIRLHTGLRAQSNANFFPASNLFQMGGTGVLSNGGPGGDVNAFQLVQAAHEYEFGAQRGDQLETRVTAYATQQFSLPQYSVALFSGAIGPRFFLPQNQFNGLSIRPYATGAVTLLG